MKQKIHFLLCLLMLFVGATQAEAQTYYEKVTSTAGITSGQYLIVYETGNVAFNGGLETLDAVSNTIAVTIKDGKIQASEATEAAEFTIDTTNGKLKSKSGKYIGVSDNSNGLKQADDATTYTNSFSVDNSKNAVIAAVFSGSTMSLRYNKANNQERFRYYKNAGQEAIQLYKKIAGLDVSFSTNEVSLNIGDTYQNTINKPEDLDVTYASSDEKVATVSKDGTVTALAAGETTITASWAAGADHSAGTASYKVTVTGAVNPLVEFMHTALTALIGRTVTNEISKPDDLPALTYSSSDENVATVDAETGIVTGVSEGRVTITASWPALGNTYNAGSVSYTVNVVEAIAPQLLFAYDPYSLAVGTSGTNPLNKPDELNVTYTIDDLNIATVDPATGLVQALATGQTTVTATWEAVPGHYYAGTKSYTLQVISPSTIVDFENDLTTYGDWTFVNIASKQTNSNVTAHGGSYFGTTGGKTTASITTKNIISYPQTLTCYLSKQSTNTTSSSWTVTVSPDGERWETVGSTSATDMDRGAWKEFSVDLSAYHDVFVKLSYDGSTAIRCIDDLTLTYASGSSPVLSTSDRTIDAGTVDVNGEAQCQFSVIQANLTGNITISTDLGSVSPATIAKGDGETTVTWTYTPTEAGDFSATITLTDEADGLTQTVDVTGTAIAPVAALPLPFVETFNTNEGSGGNDNEWNGPIAQNNIVSDNKGWEFSNEGGANHCAKFGIGKAGGSATTPLLAFEAGKTYTLAFKAAAWNGSSEKTTLNLAISKGTLSQTSVTTVKGQWTDYIVTITGAGNATVTFSTSSANSRFFLDEINIVDNESAYVVKIVDIGYATYVAAGNFVVGNAPEVYTVKDGGKSAELTKLEEGTIVNAGTPVLLKGDNGIYFLTASAAEGSELDNDLMASDGNVTGDGTIYVLNCVNDQVGFYKLKTGNKLAAGKAYLQATDTAEGVKFFGGNEPDDTPTAITNVELDAAAREGKVYNLAGQRVLRPSKGIYIIGGKKLMIK